MVRVFDDFGYEWPAPRGDRSRRWGWESTLEQRDLTSPMVGTWERVAVEGYRGLLADLDGARLARQWSLRELARQAGISVAVTSTTFSGSSWPRWPTLKAVADALCKRLELSDRPGDPIVTMVALLDSEPTFTGRSVAAEIGMRPNTLYHLRHGREASSTATVLALAAWFGEVVVARPGHGACADQRV
ncbi:helix-turn-helix domain-containing protein [Nocardioides zeicaulis]|uniref:Helix-turn-helix domain-containing protein n=1 Tax=Nocardioides zeicaulis TaxID=1776857 RepID=A0ABV6E1Z0_9ACTN